MREVGNMSPRALAGVQKGRGAEHTSTLNTVHNRRLLYSDHIKMIEAEDKYLLA